MQIAFMLTMPNPPAWNGRWSGEDRLYCLVRSFRGKAAMANAVRILRQGAFTHRWPDGWTARIEARVVTGAEAAKLRRKSDGFAGYDWMVDSIIQNGRIVAEDD